MNVVHRAALFVFASLCMVSGVAFAQVSAGEEPPDMVTDRPDQTESALTVPAKSVQIEAGIDAAKESDGTRILGVPAVLVRLGLLSRLELRVGAAYVRTTTRLDSTFAGLGGVTLGAKLQLFGGHHTPLKGALIAEVAPPVGGEGVSPAGTNGAVVLCIAEEIGSIALGANVGVELAEGDAPSGLYSLTYGSNIIGSIGGFVELFGEVSSQGAPQHLCNVGTTFQLLPNLQLDLANAFPLSDAAPRGFLTVGVSWRGPE